MSGDETWAYGHDIETKAQSSQWMGKSSPRPKSQSRSKVKVMLIASSDRKGIVRHEFVPRGQSTDSFDLNVLKRSREALRRKRTEERRNNWMFRRHNAPAHSSLLRGSFRRSTRRLSSPWPLPPFSRFVPLQPFFSFPKLKSALKGQTIEEESSLRDLRAKPQNEFQDAFRKWKKRREPFINRGGEYFQGDKSD